MHTHPRIREYVMVGANLPPESHRVKTELKISVSYSWDHFGILATELKLSQKLIFQGKMLNACQTVNAFD